VVRSATGSTAASRDTCARAKDAIFCAPTRPKKTRPSCGASCTVGDDRGGLQDPQKPAPGKAGSDLAIRPIFRQLEARIEAHVFIAFLPYCLHVTLGRRLHALAPGLTPRSVLETPTTGHMGPYHGGSTGLSLGGDVESGKTE
jgi:hypothetical protein